MTGSVEVPWRAIAVFAGVMLEATRRGWRGVGLEVLLVPPGGVWGRDWRGATVVVGVGEGVDGEQDEEGAGDGGHEEGMGKSG